MTQDYYKQKILSISTVRHFAENPSRALDDWNDVFPWFTNTDALVYGNIVHSRMEDFMNDSDEALKSMAKEWEDEGIKLYKKDGSLYTKFEDAKHTADVLEASKPVQFIKANMEGEFGYKGITELGLHGKIEGIDVKGKPDVFLVNEDEKLVKMYDYKTSRSFDISGIDSGQILVPDDENHPEGYWHTEFDRGDIIWHTEKLFPWQAGVYRELMRQNGYADYKFTYEYIVITKEKEPKITVFNIKDDAMREGLRQFSIHLKRAAKFISGEEVPIMQLDNSMWANLKTQIDPVYLDSLPIHQAYQEYNPNEETLSDYVRREI